MHFTSLFSPESLIRQVQSNLLTFLAHLNKRLGNHLHSVGILVRRTPQIPMICSPEVWPPILEPALTTGKSPNELSPGIQHSPYAGRCLAELMCGVEPVIDIQRLGLQRVLENRPYKERNIL